MKKTNYLMFVSLLMAFAFGLMSCSKDKDDDTDLSKEIIGIWDVTSSETYIDGKIEKGSTDKEYIEFKANGTAVRHLFFHDEEEISNYKYSISGNKLYMTYIFKNGEEDEVEEYEISISGKTLTMKENYEWEDDGKKHSSSSTVTYTKR